MSTSNEIQAPNKQIQLSFIAAARKAKNILVVEGENALELISLLLSSSSNALITLISTNADLYEKARAEFEKYDVLPRLSCYTANVHEILPWIEDKFDLILLNTPLSEEMVEEKLIDGGMVIVNKTVANDVDLCCFDQMVMENVENYLMFEKK